MCRNGIFIHSFILYVALSIVVIVYMLHIHATQLGKLLLKAKAQNYTNFDEDYGKTWMYLPDGDGVPQVVYLMESPIGLTRSLSVKNQTNFELYTRNAIKPKVMQLRQMRDISLEEFDKLYDPNKETKIIIHGWLSNTNSDSVQNIKDAYLQKYDVNVIAVDWASVASNFYYFTPASQTRDVGRYVSELIYYLITDRGTDVNKIHIIGHSLGAHAAGYAGSFIQPAKVARITGLDPASPKFDLASEDSRLDTSDANFVDVIHSFAGILGIRKAIGHVDFFPNNGEAVQPGCNGVKEVTEACSHARAHNFTSETGFYGYACNSFTLFLQGECTTDKMIMGDQTPPTARGIYYLKTTGASPFALGNIY